jgi:hypothetical protein
MKSRSVPAASGQQPVGGPGVVREDPVGEQPDGEREDEERRR